MRMRLRFSKLGKVRFTSHRDVARMWERALRRVELPVSYTEGFSPRPKLHFGLALSNGHESLCEYIDIDFVGDEDPDALPARLTPALPIGIDVAAAMVIDTSAPSLQADVTSCSWYFELDCLDEAELHNLVDAALAASILEIARSRKGVESTDDVRPAIQRLHVAGVVPAVGRVALVADLATQPRGLRPNELIRALVPEHPDSDDLVARVVRTQQWIERDGARREPLPVDATSLPHAELVCV